MCRAKAVSETLETMYFWSEDVDVGTKRDCCFLMPMCKLDECCSYYRFADHLQCVIRIIQCVYCVHWVVVNLWQLVSACILLLFLRFGRRYDTSVNYLLLWGCIVVVFCCTIHCITEALACPNLIVIVLFNNENAPPSVSRTCQSCPWVYFHRPSATQPTK